MPHDCSTLPWNIRAYFTPKRLVQEDVLATKGILAK